MLLGRVLVLLRACVKGRNWIECGHWAFGALNGGKEEAFGSVKSTRQHYPGSFLGEQDWETGTMTAMVDILGHMLLPRSGATIRSRDENRPVS